MTTFEVPDTTLRPFTEKAMCPKCWGEDISTVYKKNAHCTHYPDSCVMQKLRDPDCCNQAKAEHLHRRCGRCGYWWPESVVEQPGRGGGTT